MYPENGDGRFPRNIPLDRDLNIHRYENLKFKKIISIHNDYVWEPG
jgi:hypothetical protein